MSDTVSVLLFLGVIAYALFGGADFGAGFWDLTAGGAARGSRPRKLIDVSIGPVWEANHTWLIYCLVMLWSAFPPAFTAITTTLYIPLGLAALGIVLRGAGFAFRKASMRTPEQRIYGVAFAASSVLTPYCFGSVAGAIASGRVPTAGAGDPLTSWNNPTSALGGVLAVAVCAYLAAVYLTVSAAQNHSPELEAYFRRRALLAGVVTGAVGLAGIFVLQADSPRLFHDLSHRGLALLIISALCGLASLALLRSERPVALRALATLAVATVVCGWGVAQYPYLLGTHLRIDEAAAPTPTLWVLTGVAVAAGALIAPSLALLYVLQNRGRLETRS
ncbi:cytochrome d ubiquinol oxidase subunit II [Streptomyces sp. GMY02]|uniref:cytochrome d ubiquinol oxidase subunit II n=1 Tax=Streptomyces sp. GMY02 TaxID=1333528 RepID=UPI001C2C9401|nr:cytochrome d ubiquinol oxidase subunit II [Streptomyces sp. GMY02]QXE33979.1 cytochrome d ubiquinol oxidase subunit II [Streptomyces sp. GMY02]